MLVNTWCNISFRAIFLLTFDLVVSNERRTVCAGKCHKSPGGTPLYKPYRYVPPQRVGFLRRFDLKTGIDFPHFGPESVRVWFSRELRECTKVFIVSIPNEQQRERNMPIRNGF